MKKSLLLLWLTLAMGFALPAQTVYITKTGEKYHTGTCRYLSKSKTAIDLNDALAQGYTACKVCQPAQSPGSNGKKTNNPKTKTGSRSAEATQCGATTQKGGQCKRMTKSPNGKCWQHGGD